MGAGSTCRRFTIGQVMIGIAALAILIGLATYYTQVFVVSLFVGINVLTFFMTRPASPRKQPRREPRRFRFSIWQIMAVAAFVAVILTIFRAVASAFFATNPMRGRDGSFWMGIALMGVFLGILVFVLSWIWSMMRLFFVGSKGERRVGFDVRALEERTLGEDHPATLPARVAGGPGEERADL